jgi:hypothetical protein
MCSGKRLATSLWTVGLKLRKQRFISIAAELQINLVNRSLEPSKHVRHALLKKPEFVGELLFFG